MSEIIEPAATAASESGRPSGWRQLRKLVPYLQRYKGMVALGLLTLLTVGVIGALPQLLIGAITDCLKGSPRPLSTLSGTSRELLRPIFSLYTPFSRHTLSIYCLMLLGVALVKEFFTFWMRRILIGVSYKIAQDIRNDLHSQFMKLEPEFYARNRTGDLMSRATNDLNAVQMLLGQGILHSATTIMTTVITVYFMYELSPMLTLWVLLAMPLIAITYWYFGRIINRLSDKVQESLGALSARVQEHLTGIRVVRAYVQEKHEIEQFDSANRGYAIKNAQLISIMSIFLPALYVIASLSFMTLLWIGGRQAMNHQISVGTLLAFYAFLVRLVLPMMALGWVTNVFQRGAASAVRLNYILTSKPGIGHEAILRSSISPGGENGDGRHRRDVCPGMISTGASILGEIEFRHLTFTYPTASSNGSPAQATLRDIDLRIPAGSTLAIVGPTGSGKSTLAALIARLWESPPGTLLLDGRPILEYPLDELRRAIGYVPQETILFSDTIHENIAFGVNNPPEADVCKTAEIASILGEIQAFPERFETMVGERGITLSGGQKQRIALARAILRQPKILVLDDALSSVDTDTEAQILLRLRDVMRRRTTILISNRVSALKSADQIIVLCEGRIVERGTHEELLTLGGYYADLHHKQLLEQELEFN
jgi:ATP-binding cassette, subfamily B, multidrug efflux pump